MSIKINNEVRLLIKNELEYLKFKQPKSKQNSKIIYKKYKSIIDKSTNFLSNNKTFSERIYCFINNITKIYLCQNCKINYVKFKQYTKGYAKYCSNNCSGESKKRIDDLLLKFNEIHNNKYIYDWTTYKSYHEPMKIICPIHGEFWQSPANHTESKGCKKCGLIYRSNNRTLTFEQVFIEIEKLHNTSLFYYYKETYINQSIPMKIKCLKCNKIFYQTPYNHKRGCGCTHCVIVERTKNLTTSLDILKYDMCDSNFYYYWNTYIKSSDKMKIKCLKCNRIFYREPSSHKIKLKCPYCKKSAGEDKIKDFLFDNNINFISQKRFDNCRNILPLPFDFYLTKHNICIEYDGEQHYISIYGENQLHETQNNDMIKTEYCKNNNIQLIRIPYWDFDNIENILRNSLNKSSIL